jgi:hypothetical protein
LNKSSDVGFSSRKIEELRPGNPESFIFASSKLFKFRWTRERMKKLMIFC